MKIGIRVLFSLGLMAMIVASCQSDNYLPENDHKIWKVKDVPRPAGLKGHNFISDPDHLLAPAEIQMMNDFIREIKDSTGLKITVIVVSDIGRADIHVFAHDLFRYWEYGNKEPDILLFVSTDQMLWSFDVSNKAYATLPTLTCDQIAQEYLAPRLRAHQYSQGITDVLYEITRKLNIHTNKESSLAYQISRSPLTPFRNYINWLMVVYLSIILLIYNTKRRERSFAHLFFMSYTDQQAKVLSYIPFWQWVSQYVLMPVLWLGVLYVPETAEYPGKDIIIMWLCGVYILMLCWLVEHRLRVNRQLYERTRDDAGLLYTRYIDSHRGWVWVAVFFPFPFLFYYIWYGRRLRMLRNLTRPVE